MSRSSTREPSLASGITGMTVLGEEKFVKQTVHLHEAFAAENDILTAHRSEALAAQPAQLRGKPFARIDPVALDVIPRLHAAQLQTQDEFADKALLVRGMIGAVIGHFAAVHEHLIGKDVRVILHMHVAESAKGGHSQR